tara:strand:- start:129 stop:308 length:180 start_codon:yes stop_codon:yes gene_type:complete
LEYEFCEFCDLQRIGTEIGSEQRLSGGKQYKSDSIMAMPRRMNLSCIRRLMSKLGCDGK